MTLGRLVSALAAGNVMPDGSITITAKQNGNKTNFSFFMIFSKVKAPL
jgi:hypothetical protein